MTSKWRERSQAIERLMNDYEWLAGEDEWDRRIGAAKLLDKGKRTAVFRAPRANKLTPISVPAPHLIERSKRA